MQLALFNRKRSEEVRVLARYRSLRETGKKLHASLLKHVPKGAIQKSARRLGISSEGATLVFAAESELDVLADYCIHDYREPPYKRPSWNAVERKLALSPPAIGSDERLLLDAASRARYCLLLAGKRRSGVGVEVTDTLRQEDFLLVDVGFSETAVEGMALAARVIEPEGIRMTTGAALPIPDRAALEAVLAGLVDAFGDRYVETVDALSPHDQARLSAAIIRACLAHGASSRIVYE